MYSNRLPPVFKPEPKGGSNWMDMKFIFLYIYTTNLHSWWGKVFLTITRWRLVGRR
jgi:hypothetical protein